MRTISSGCKERSWNRACRFRNIQCQTVGCAQGWWAPRRRCGNRSANSRRRESICCCCNSARNWKKWKYSAPASCAMPPAAERPLAVRFGAFGDMVLLTALIRVLHARFNSPVDILTSGPWSEPLLRGQPGVGEMWTVRSRKTPYWLSPDQRRAVRQLRARGAGPTWFCDGNEAARPLLERAGIPQEFIVDVKHHPLLPGEHATEQWRRLAQIMPAAVLARAAAPAPGHGGTPDSVLAAAAAAAVPGCSLEVSDQQRTDLLAWLRARNLADSPLIAIQMGNKRTMRRGLR